MMKYKGYLGHVVYDAEARIFHGEVVGLTAVVTFQGKSVDELEKAFHDSIECYVALCEEMQVKPEKTFSGTFNLRIDPALHARLVIKAKTAGVSLNSFIAEKLLSAMEYQS